MIHPHTPETLAHQNHTGDWVQQKSVQDNMLRVFIRHADYDALHLQEGVRLFVAEGPCPVDGKEAAVTATEGEGAHVSVAGSSSAPVTHTHRGPAAKRRVDGFVLVDPLWKEGRVFGYVTSLNRMRRDGHQGAPYVWLHF